MVQSAAATVAEYIAGLPAERAAVIAHVRDMVNEHLPEGYQEQMLYGMITWAVPLESNPDTYNGKPLAFISLAAQKRHYALYLMSVYADSAEEARLREEWQARGSRLDMGRSCLRFRRLEDLHEDLVAGAIAAVPMEEFAAMAEQARAARRSRGPRTARSVPVPEDTLRDPTRAAEARNTHSCMAVDTTRLTGPSQSTG